MEKADSLLNLALDATPEERSRSPALRDAENIDGRWDILVKNTRSLSYLEDTHPQIDVVTLSGGYSVLTLPKELIGYAASLEDVIFLEMPKRLLFEDNNANAASCIPPVYQNPPGLSGKGVLTGFIDSGIDTTHPDFRKENGDSRILFLWDQTKNGTPPAGFRIGTEYSLPQINAALRNLSSVSDDPTGHGTAVAGIAAGNGRASDGLYRGVAFESDLIVVKMRPAAFGAFPRTTELIMGIEYCIRKAIELRRPLSLNISFGNNYGAHNGSSLLESFLNQAAAQGRTSVIVGSGNEGSHPIHTAGKLTSSAAQTAEFSVGPYEPSLDIQLWKNYADDVRIYLESPDGIRIGPLFSGQSTQKYHTNGADLLIYYGSSLPYQFLQEIFIQWIPSGSYLPEGIWRILLEPIAIKNGTYHLWLPGQTLQNTATRFLKPVPYGTLTIPSTAEKAITVGAYDSYSGQYADFSGRGIASVFPSSSAADPFVSLSGKPDLVAPGVGITAPAPYASYRTFTGTSFSAPIVSGSAALLMEWGIIQKNDPFLYGEKLKAVLCRSARQLTGFTEPPNLLTGYGALCLSDALTER